MPKTGVIVGTCLVGLYYRALTTPHPCLQARVGYLARDMAQRRMFSPEIVCSEEFLDMPATSRELYFQLGIRADDDGFIQPNTIIKVIGASKDDLKVLLSKRFLLPFESGVVVIKHWLIHNMIRADRYKPTRFQEERKVLFIKDNNAYTDKEENGVPLLATKWQPNGNRLAPQVRLGKVSITSALGNAPIEEVKDEPQTKTKSDTSYQDVFKLFNTTPMGWWRHKSQIEAAKRMLVTPGITKVKALMDFYREHDGEPYMPKVYKPFDLEAKVDQLLDFKKRNNL